MEGSYSASAETTPSGKIYKMTYGLPGIKSLIDVSSISYIQIPVHVTVHRHDKNTVYVEYTLTSDVVARADRNEVEDDSYKKYGWFWTPLWSDIESENKLCSHQPKCIYRGGNRLSLELREPGRVVITVPRDSDLKVVVDEGTIVYVHDPSYPTMLSIKCPHGCVNRWGSNGCSIPNDREEWDYYWGSRTDPFTRLTIDRKGAISV